MSDTALREPWPDLGRQQVGVEVGIWVFLASEVLFFSALFLGYTVYRSFNVEAFRRAAAETEIFYGTINLAFLLTSSATMTVAMDASRRGLRSTTIFCLGATMLLGLAFLACKGLEYRDDLGKGLFPGPHFPLAPPATQIFWAFYWVMTGIHAVHLTTGIAVVAVLAVLYWRRANQVQSPAIRGVAAYWHFVDTVWIVLFPLIYLPGRS
jgi:heme/copper-type cytochrome/quinol oxidase subunit 3